MAARPTTEQELDRQLRDLSPDRWIDGPDFRLLARKRVTTGAFSLIVGFYIAPVFEKLSMMTDPLLKMLPREANQEKEDA